MCKHEVKAVKLIFTFLNDSSSKNFIYGTTVHSILFVNKMLTSSSKLFGKLGAFRMLVCGNCVLLHGLHLSDIIFNSTMGLYIESSDELRFATWHEHLK
jgi:hypothetical protein